MNYNYNPENERVRIISHIKYTAVIILFIYGAWAIVSQECLVLERLTSKSLTADRYVQGCKATLSGYRYIAYSFVIGLWITDSFVSTLMQIIRVCLMAICFTFALLTFTTWLNFLC